jgi:hypothetical protein
MKANKLWDKELSGHLDSVCRLPFLGVGITRERWREQ